MMCGRQGTGASSAWSAPAGGHQEAGSELHYTQIKQLATNIGLTPTVEINIGRRVMIKLYARFKFESTRSCFQPGGGPSRGLLRNYEPFCGPPLEALIFPPRLDNCCNLLRPLSPARTLPTGQRTEAGPRIRIIINIDTLPRHYTLDTAHTGEWRSITWSYLSLSRQTNDKSFF